MNETHRLDRCSLHAEERVLRCGDQIVPLSPKAFDVLGALLGRRGEVISKDELMDAVWGDAAVEEANLTQSIYQLRRALRDWDPAVRIENIPCRGYRLLVGTPNSEPEPEPEMRPKVKRPSSWTLGAVAVSALLIALAGTWWHQFYRPSNAVPPSFAIGYQIWSTGMSLAADRQATLYFKKAIAEEPHSALGYAGLADASLSLALRTIGTSQMAVYVRAAFSAARKAVALNPNSADAHAAFGQAHALFGDPAVASRELRRATELDPTLVEARTWYGEYLMAHGDVSNARVQFRAGLAQNSNWTQPADDLALLAYLRRDYTRSVAYAGQSIAQRPSDQAAAYVRALSNGQIDRSNAERELKALGNTHTISDVAVDALLSFYQSEDHNQEQSAVSLSRAERMIRSHGWLPYPSAIISLAAALAAHNQSDSALAWLERVDIPLRKLFANDPRLDALQGNPRFVRWLRAR